MTWGWGAGSFVHRLRMLKRACRHALKQRDKQDACERRSQLPILGVRLCVGLMSARVERGA